MSKLIVSPSPHIHSKDSTRSLMRDVVIALIPAVICSVVFYGWQELLVLGVSVASCVLLEWAITKYMLKQPSTIGDLSAVITGILLALNVPYTTPWWVIVIGAVVAIGVAKMTFGGLGQNIWNPALVGRVFLLVSFPTYMTTWSAPKGLFGADAVTGATPLGAIQEGLMSGASVQELTSAYNYRDLLFANLGGSAGFTDPLFNLLTGGLVLGACFMATDYVTSPMSLWGGVVFGVGIGFLTMMIRYFGSYPEGVSFAILLMNSVVPLLNMWFKQKKFGRK